MRRLLTILFLCSLTFGAVPSQKPMLGELMDHAHPLGNPVLAMVFNEGAGLTTYDSSSHRIVATAEN